LAPGAFEVDFSDDNGQTDATRALSSYKLMRLHYEPRHGAAEVFPRLVNGVLEREPELRV